MINRWTRITAATSGAVMVAAPAVALAQAMPGTGPWGMHDGWFGWWPRGGLIWLLVLGLAIVGLIAVMHRLRGREDGSGASAGALAILDERYARGEIDREEYLRRRKDIGGD